MAAAAALAPAGSAARGSPLTTITTRWDEPFDFGAPSQLRLLREQDEHWRRLERDARSLRNRLSLIAEAWVQLRKEKVSDRGPHSQEFVLVPSFASATSRWGPAAARYRGLGRAGSAARGFSVCYMYIESTPHLTD